MSSNRLVVIASAFKTHGLKGGVHLRLSDQKEGLLLHLPIEELKQKKFILEPHGREVFISSLFGIGSETLKVTFLGIDSIDEIEKLLPFELTLVREELPLLDSSNSFYLHDFFQQPVHSFETKEKIGKIIGHEEYGAQTNFQIELSNEIIDIPFNKQFFPTVKCDPMGKIVYIEIVLPTFI